MLWLLEHLEQLDMATVNRFLPLCFVSRQERIRAVKNEPGGTRMILGELLLRYAVHQETGRSDLPELRTGEQGKPYFPDCPDLCFNLSHCKTAVACALDASPLGVDVQDYRLFTKAPDPHDPPVFRVLSPTERAWVCEIADAAARDRRFIQVWTCKEAYGKSLGVGLAYAFRQTAFRPAPEPWTQYGFTFTHWSGRSDALTLCAAGSLPLQIVPARKLLSFFQSRCDENV